MIILWDHSFTGSLFGGKALSMVVALPYNSLSGSLSEAVLRTWLTTTMRVGMTSRGQQKQSRNGFSMDLQPECFYSCILMFHFLHISRVFFFFFYLSLAEAKARKACLILMRFNITYLYSSIQDLFLSVNVRISIAFHRNALFPGRDYSPPEATVQTLQSDRTEHLPFPSVPAKSNSFILEKDDASFE